MPGQKQPALVKEVYNVKQILNSFHPIICIFKVACFFLMDTMAFFTPKLFSNINFLENLVYGNFGYTILVIIVLAVKGIIRVERQPKFLRWILALLLFPQDYVALPLKTLCLSALIANDQSMLILPVILDVCLNVLAASVQISLFREFKPSRTVFFSVIESNAETVLFFLSPFRAIIASLGTSASGSIVTALAMVCPGIISFVLVVVFLWERPFFNRIAERLFEYGLVLQFCISLPFGLGMYLFATMCLGTLHAFRQMRDNSELNLNKNMGAAVMRILIEGKPPGVKKKGEFRDHLWGSRKFAEVIERCSKGFKVPAGVIQEAPNLEDRAKSSAYRASSVNIYSRRGDEDHSRLLRESNIGIGSHLTLTKSQEVRQKIQTIKKNDEQMEDYLVSTSLSDKKDGYHIFLRLMWVIDHRFSIAQVFHLLSELRVKSTKFSTTCLYYTAKREIEKKLIELNQVGPLLNIDKAAQMARRQAQGAEVDDPGAQVREMKTQLLRCVEENLDIAHVFYYKDQLKKFIDLVELFSRMNMEYLDHINHTNLDLYPRTILAESLFKLDKTIRDKFKHIDSLTASHDFQHLLPYFYHLLFNVNKHATAATIKLEINSRFRTMKAIATRSTKKITNLNVINESVTLIMESSRQRVGTILNIYGKTEMFLESADELVGCSFTIFMNETLRDYHASIMDLVYEDQYGKSNAYNFNKSKYGFIKVPFRNIILPSVTVVRICPFHLSDFKFVGAIRPDFNDDKFYIALNSSVAVDGYSASLLSICSEEYLQNGISLNKVCNQASSRISTYAVNDTEVQKTKRNINKPKTKTRVHSQFKESNDNRNASVAGEDGKSWKSGVNSHNPYSGKFSCYVDILLEDKVKFFSSTNQANAKPIEKSFRIVLKYHQFPSGSKGDIKKGYWYMSLTSNSEQDLIEDLLIAHHQQLFNPDGLDHSLSVNKNHDKIGNSEGILNSNLGSMISRVEGSPYFLGSMARGVTSKRNIAGPSSHINQASSGQHLIPNYLGGGKLELRSKKTRMLSDARQNEYSKRESPNDRSAGRC